MKMVSEEPENPSREFQARISCGQAIANYEVQIGNLHGSIRNLQSFGPATFVGRLVAAPATTAAAASATATATATITTTAAAPLFARASFVDGQRATIDFFLIQALDRSLGLAVVGHFDKAKTLAAARVAIHADLGALHPPELGEERFQALIRDVVTEVSDVESRSHYTIP